jgi:glycosyltransferase involved in cell wall biosynthesis
MVTERNMYSLSGWALWRRRMQFLLLKFVGVTYSANSGAVALNLSKMLRYPVDKFPVVNNGFNIPNLQADSIKAIRQMYGWSEQDVVIGYTSRLTRHKGQLFFLEIFQELSEQGLPVKACFVGDGPDRAWLENWVEDNQLSSLVTFTGIVTNTEEVMGSFDICALLSDHEGMPNVVMEAMACGKPVVAHPVGNVNELFDDGGGIVVPLFEKKMILEVFIELIEDPARRKELGNLARRKIQNEFSLAIVVNKLMLLYQE